MDSIYIQDLEVWTHIGVPTGERAQEQRLLVSLELFHDLSAAAKTDDVSKSIDYALVATDVQALASTPRKTLERFAEDVAKMILKTYAPAGGVKVSVQKFALPNAKAVHVTLVRNA